MLVDTNILVFSTQETSPRHRAANARLYDLHSRSEPLWVSRQTLREYLAVVTRPQGLRRPLSSNVAVSDIRQFERLFAIAEDGEVVTSTLLDLVERFPVTGAQIHDANVVATMLTHGINRLLTDNVTDFTRFSSLIEVVPLDA